MTLNNPRPIDAAKPENKKEDKGVFVPPMISVLLCAYNGGPDLAKSVESILSQSFVDFELILVDDGSTDGSIERIREESDPRIKIIKKKNTGLTHSLNVGIEQCNGKYIARQDADDYSHKDRFKAQFEFMEKHPGVGVLGSGVTLIDDDDDVIGGLSFHGTHEALLSSHIMANQFVHGAIMVRRDLLKQVGGYREAFIYAQDYDLTLRCQEITELANLPEAYYSLRFGRNRISISHAKDQRAFASMARQFAKQRRKTGFDELMMQKYDGDLTKYMVENDPVADQNLIMLYLYLRSGRNGKARACLQNVLKQPLTFKEQVKYRMSYVFSYLPANLSRWIYLGADRLRQGK